MRRALVSAVLSAAIAVTGLVGVAPAQAVTGGPIDDTAFGMHVPQIANGVTGPTVNYGTAPPLGLRRRLGPGAAEEEHVLVERPRRRDRQRQRAGQADHVRPRLDPEVGGQQHQAGHVPEQGRGLESQEHEGLEELGHRRREAATATRSSRTRSGTRPTSRRSGRARPSRWRP